MRTSRLLIIPCLFGVIAVYGQGDFLSRAVPPGLTGNWNDITSWTFTGTDGDGIPDGDDNVTIQTAHTIFVNVTSACNNLTLDGSGQLNFNLDTRSLTVNGTMTMNGTSTVVGGGTNRILSLQGNFVIPTGQQGSIGDVTVTQLPGASFTILGEFRPNGTSGTKTLGNVIIGSAGTQTGRWNYTVVELYSLQSLTMYDGPTGESVLDGAATATITVNGAFTVLPTLAGYQSKIANVSITVSGATNVSGYLIFTVSGSGNKIFNGTITVNPGGTWDNIIGEDPDVNCSIVNNGNWPPPTGGLCRYRVNIAGSYTYTGANPINFGRLRVDQGTVTNLTTLVLLGDASLGLRVNSAGVFNNGNGVVPSTLRFLASGTVADLLGVGATINFANTNNTVEYAFAGNQDIYPTTYYNLVANNSGTKTQTGNVVVSNSLSLDGSVVYNTSTQQLSGAANLTMAGTSELQFARTGVDLPELTGVSNTLAATTTITFSGAGAQTAKSSTLYPYRNVRISGGVGSAVNLSNVATITGNLTLSGTGALTAIASGGLTVVGSYSSTSTGATDISGGTGSLTVGSISVASGGFNYSGKTITINGNSGSWLNNGGMTFTDNTSSTVRFETGTGQQLGGSAATTFRNLVIDNSNGVTLVGTSNPTINQNLNLINGRLITSAQRVIATGTVARTTGFVEGNLQKPVTTGASITRSFEVGTGSVYSPVTVVFASISAAGTGFMVSSTAGDHPDILSANIEPNFSVNRFYTFTNVGPITFTTLNATLNFDAGDVDAGFLPVTQAAVRGYNNTNWFAVTTGTRAATSTQITGLAASLFPNNAARSFQIGRRIITTGFFNRLTGTQNWHDATTWINNRTGVITLTNGSATVMGAGTDFLDELVDGDQIVLQSNAGGAPLTIDTRVSDTELTLTAPYLGTTTSGGYGRLRVPNSSTDSVSVGNTLIADVATAIQLNANATVNTLNVGTTGRNTAHSVVHVGTNALTVTANTVVNQPGGSVTNLWNIDGGSATVAGNVTLASNVNNIARIARVQLSSGTLSIGGNISFNTSTGGNQVTAVLNTGTSGRVNLSGSLLYTNDRGTLTMGTNSVFNFNRTVGSQDIDFPNINPTSFVFSNIEGNNTSTNGVRVIESITATNVTGNIRVLSGKLQMVASGNPNITGSAGQTLEVANGATLEMLGNGTQLFPQSFGTYTLGASSHVIFAQTAGITMPLNPTSYGNLSFRGAVPYTITNPTFTINGDLTIGTGTSNTTLTGSGTTTLILRRDFVLNSSATFNATNIPSITIDGNWTSSGTFTAGTGTNFVEFSGLTTAQPQVIAGTAADLFNNLRLNTDDATDRVRLDKSISVANQLTLTQGGLVLNGNRLSITNPVTTAIARTAPGFIQSETTGSPYSRVRWTINTATGAFVFPFGLSDAGADYIPFTFNVTGAGAPSGTFEVATYPTAANNTPYPLSVTNMNGGGDNNGGQVVDRFWILTPSGFGTTTPTATLTFTCTATERTAVSGNLRAHRWNPANYWDGSIVGQSNPTVNAVQVPGVTSFSPWTLASESAPLPIQLKNFDAVYEQGGVRVSWSTASELRNEFFSVERSLEGEAFTEIARVPGAGDSRQERSYEVIDPAPLSPAVFYRLRQTDWDGAYTYSEVVKVVVPARGGMQLFPNPVESGAVFSIRMRQLPSQAWIRVVSAAGVPVFEDQLPPNHSGDIQMNRLLAPGVYVIEVFTTEGAVRQKLIVK